MKKQEQIFMYKPEYLTKKDIENYPQKTIWVEVWHLAWPSRFEITIRQNADPTPNKTHINKDIILGTVIAYPGINENNLNPLLNQMKRMTEILGIKLSAFYFYGSTFGNSEWLRKAYQDFSILPKCKESST